MHVLGVRFATPDAARSALREIRATIAVPAADVAVGALGSTSYDEPATEYLLAGQFADELVEAAAVIAERHGGVVVSRRAAKPSFRDHPLPARPSSICVAPAIRAGLAREQHARRIWARHPAALRHRVAREHRLSRQSGAGRG
jgi:hypothetical protein